MTTAGARWWRGTTAGARWHRGTTAVARDNGKSNDGGREEPARDGGGSRTVEKSEEVECGPSSKAPTATKRRRLSAITAMGDEPLQEWLDSLPREDLQHMAIHEASRFFQYDENQHSCCSWRDTPEE